MCDFHLQGKCFNKNITGKHKIAVNCSVHGCAHCTNKEWQKHQLREELNFFNHLPMQELILEQNEINIIASISTILKK